MGDSEYGNVNATANNTAGDESQARETLAEITDTIPCDPGVCILYTLYTQSFPSSISCLQIKCNN